MNPLPSHQAADWAYRNKKVVSANLYVAQILVGLFLMGFSYRIAKVPFHLIRGAAETTGRIAGYKFIPHKDVSPTLAVIVEFQVEGRGIQFTNWMGSRYRTFPIGSPVRIRYASADPSIAMIDSRVWIPFAGMFGVGAFLCFVGVKSKILSY